jgi:rubredoxin
MKSGTCPKCKAQSVYNKLGGISYGDGAFHVYTGAISRGMRVDSYVCANCGYFEAYVPDPAKLQEVAKTWTKVAGGGG